MEFEQLRHRCHRHECALTRRISALARLCIRVCSVLSRFGAWTSRQWMVEVCRPLRYFNNLKQRFVHASISEYIAVIAFVIVFFWTRDVFLATAVLLVAVSAQVAFYKLTKRPLSNELKITFWLSLILGGLTLILRDETFIQWKPSIISWAMALGLVGAMWFAKMLVLKKCSALPSPPRTTSGAS